VRTSTVDEGVGPGLGEVKKKNGCGHLRIDVFDEYRTGGGEGGGTGKKE